MSDFANEVSGIPPAGNLDRPERGAKTTAGIQVQRATYSLAKAIFEFSPPTFALSDAVRYWKAQESVNLAGKVPETFEVETRVGAALSLLGYLESSDVSGITAVLAASGTLRVMEPMISRHLAEFRTKPVVFQTAAVDYDAQSGQLVSDRASVLRVARNHDLTLVSSSLSLPNDAFHSAVLAAVLARSPELGPAIHLFDGVRGTRQAFTEAEPSILANGTEIPAVDSVAAAFNAANGLLGTNLRPFEYYGPTDPQTVYVTLGAPEVLAKAVSGSENSVDLAVGVLNVRLYRPFLTAEFLQALPSSAVQIVVVGDGLELFLDVNAAVRQHFGFRHGPQVTYTPLSALEPLSPQPDTVLTVWDSDRSLTAKSAARFAGASADASVFAKFDNCVAGGAVAAEVRPAFAGQFWDAKESDVTVVHNTAVLQSVDVSAHTKPRGRVVIVAASDDELSKSVPAPIKLRILAKEQQVLRFDLGAVPSAATEGRTALLATQAALWLLTGASFDEATSRIVHANSQDTELVAVTVNEIIVKVKEVLLPVGSETLQDWTKIELSEKDNSRQFATTAGLTSFAPLVADAASEASGESTGSLESFDLKKRMVFAEAYETREELRPDAGTRTAVAKVKLNQRVTPDDYDRHIFKLELDIGGTGLKYAIGEALGVHAPNRKADVVDFLRWYEVDFEAVHTLPSLQDPDTKMFRTAYQIARDHLDLFGKVPKRFYEGLLAYATDADERAKIEHLLSPAGVEDLKRRSEVEFENYVDVLREFPSAHPTFAELIDLVAPLKRREYSIASSQRAHPNEVHLLIVVVDWVNSRGEKRYGQCSKFLSDLAHGDEVVVSVKPSVLKLPKDPATPIIMAGLGTGLAPFKAFLEEKQWQREQGYEIGEVYLFLGSRHQRQEYLYGELFEAYKAAGVLTHIGAAFSRDQPEKIYIQNRIQQAKSELANAFVKKQGNFYLCGPTWPVPDISAALTEIVREGNADTGVDIDEATLIEDLKEAERYVLEVY